MRTIGINPLGGVLIAVIITLTDGACASDLAPLVVGHYSGSNDGPMVVLERRIRRDYAAPDLQDAYLADLFDSASVRVVEFQQGDTLSKVIASEFGVLQRRSPKHFTALVSRIKEINRITDPAKIDQGKLFVPDLPKAAGQGTVYPQIGTSSVSIGKSNVLVRLDGNEFPVVGLDVDGLPVARRVIGPQNSEFDIQLNDIPEAWESLSQMPYAKTKADVEEGFPYPVSRGLEVLLGAPETSSAGGWVMVPEMVNQIKAVLNKPEASKPIVIVLDDSWPDRKEFERSVAFFSTVSETIRKAHGLPATELDFETLKKLGTDFPKGEYPNSLQTHAALIKKSLEPFTSIDWSSRIEVIYLPMIRAQSGSEELLSELIRINRGIQLRQYDKRNQDVGSIAGRVEQEIDFAMKRLDTTLAGIKPNLRLSLTTDQAVINAVHNVLRLYTDPLRGDRAFPAMQVPKRPIFLSWSWSVPNNTYYVPWDTIRYGTVVVAAGNDSKNYVAENVQYAARSVQERDMMAVINLDHTGGRVCGSNLPDIDPNYDALVLGFSGQVSQGNCGTSFSTPRVAWLLALAESQYMAPGSESVMFRWKQDFERRIKLARADAQIGERRFLLNAEKLLRIPSQN